MSGSGVRRRAAAAGEAFVATARSADLRRAQLGFAGSWTAEWAFTVALGVYAFEQGGAAAVGLMTVLRMVPTAVLTPAATSVVDRFPREQVLVGVSVVRAAVTAVAAGAVAVDGPAGVVYLLAAVSTLAGVLYRPAHSALVPSLCRTPYELASANVVRGMLDSVATLVGPAVAAALLGSGGVPAALLACTAASGWSALLLLRVHVRERAQVATAHRPWVEAREGLQAVARNRDLFLMLALTGVQTAMRGALAVVTVVVAIDVLGSGGSGAGTLMAAVGAGAVVGSVAASFLVGSRRLARWFGTGVALWGLPLSLVALTDRPWLVLLLLMALGVGNALVDVGLFTLVARLAPDAVLGRVFGVLEAVAALTVAAGSVATPWAFDTFGLRDGLLAVGAVAPASVLLTWGWLRRLDTTMGVRDRDLALLRDIPMLAPLPLPALEHLARALEPVEVPAGADVVVEGEPGDRFFVVESGRAEVLGADGAVAELGPGDSFGEIALLRQVPRTATVRATTDVVLRSLAADRFLTVVSGSPTTVRRAGDHVDELLDRYRPPGT